MGAIMPKPELLPEEEAVSAAPSSEFGEEYQYTMATREGNC